MSGSVSVPDNPPARIGSAIVVVVFALLVASAITGPLIGLGVAVGLFVEGSAWISVARVVIQFGGILLGTVAYLVVTGELDALGLSMPDRRETGLVVVGAVGLLLLQYGALFALTAAGVTTGRNRATVPTGDPVTYYLAMVVVSLLVVGPVEEFLFRGVVQGGLRRAFDAVPAIVIASALFAVIHLPALEGAPGERLAYVGVVVLLGCLLGYLYERTGNVVVPAIAHGCYNAAIYATLLAGAM